MPQEPEYLQTAKGRRRHFYEFHFIQVVKRFILSRWSGEAPLATVFWRDMILTGTLINIMATLTMVALLAVKAPILVALTVFFTPLPLNFFLVVAVWRSARRSAGSFTLAAQMGAILWLILAFTL